MLGFKFRLMSRLAFLKLWPYIKLFATHLGKLYPLPDLNNEARCREWLRDLLQLGGELAAETATSIDDEITAAFERLVADDDAWEIGFDLFQMILRTDDGEKVGQSPEAIARADQLKEKVGIGPLMILQIVAAIVALVRQLRK